MSLANALLRSDEVYCPFDQSGVAVGGATNAANSLFISFLPSTPTLLTPPPLLKGIFYTPQFHWHGDQDQDSKPWNSTIDIYDILAYFRAKWSDAKATADFVLYFHSPQIFSNNRVHTRSYERHTDTYRHIRKHTGCIRLRIHWLHTNTEEQHMMAGG